ncbi:Aldose 1-epimerase [Thalassocella blandensis]|nr:Aldose 1-epimerase [Thalassocella blandensis]
MFSPLKEPFTETRLQRHLRYLLYISAPLLLNACEKQSLETLKDIATPPSSTVSVSADTFGFMPDGSEVIRYTLTTPDKLSIKLLAYGGIIQSIQMPDKNGALADVVLGFDTLADYLADQRYFGPLIGRYANRIEFGQYTFNGQKIQLDPNRKGHHLHGGSHGFHKVLWESESYQHEHAAGVKLILFSPDGDNGYPGNMEVTVNYELNDQNELRLTFEANTDKATPVSMTNHSYFNLAGQGTVLKHKIQIHAQHFTPVDSTLIPTGEIQSVENTSMDLRQPTVIEVGLSRKGDQMTFGQGFDHNWVIKQEQSAKILPMVTLTDPASGRKMEILSNAPGLQFYSGNFLNDDIVGKNKMVYRHRTGLVLEPQQFPNAPNETAFPSPIIAAADKYQHTIIYRFSNQADANNTILQTPLPATTTKPNSPEQ